MNSFVCSLFRIGVMAGGLVTAVLADTPLTFGTTTSGTLGEPGAQHRYTFSGTAGQRFVYDALDADGVQINASLLNPAGVGIWVRNSDSDFEPFTVVESGTYTLLIDGAGAAVGPYAFRLLDVGSQPEFPLDTVISDTLNPGLSARVYRLNGTAGQRLYFDGLGANVGAQWYLYGPNNTALVGAGIGADFEVTLGQSGPHVLVLYGTRVDPVPYSIQGVGISVTSRALTLGSTATGSIAKQGNQEVYTFTGAPGQRIIYDGMDADSLQINARLVNPSGGVIWERNSDTDVEPVTLLEPGTHTLVIDGIGAVTGPYRFRLLNVADQPVLPLDTVITETLDPGVSARVYRLQGTAGDRLYFDGLGANAGAAWYLYGPNNVAVSGTGIGSDMEVILGQSGLFVLGIFGSSANPLPFSVQVLSFESPSDSLTLGSTVSGTIALPGDQHTYTFTGSVGQRIYYDALDADFEQIYCRLISPSGILVWDFINQSSDGGPVALLENGTYQVLIDGSVAATGDYRFRLVDLATALPLGLTGTTTGSLNPASAMVAYRYDGTAGQRLNFDNISATQSQATWRLVGPSLQTLISRGVTTDLGDVVLPETGTYWLLVEGTSDSVAPLQYQFVATDRSDAPVTVSDLGIVRSGTIAAGQMDTNTFTAPAGLWVYFDSQDRAGAGSLVADLLDPTGVLLFSVNAAFDSGPYVLPFSGTYRLVIRGPGAGAVGTYRYRLLDLVGGIPPLALNTTVTATLDPGYRTDVHLFTGTPGQRFIYDALENDFANVTVRLMTPDGQIRFLNGNSDQDIGPFTLTVGGSYRLFFENQLPAPATYAFRLLDAAAQPVLTFDTLVSQTLDPGLSISVYRFEGTPGQRVFFDGLTTTGAGTWYLFGPNNENLGGTSLTGDIEAVTAQPGRHLLVQYGNSATPIPVSFQAYTPDTGPQGGLRITSIRVDTGEATLVWDSVAATQYRVQYKSALSQSGWTDLPGDVTASDASASKSDSTLGADSERYYQIITVP